MPSTECHTDHSLDCCILKFQYKPKPKRRGTIRKKVNVGFLGVPDVEASFQADLQCKLEEKWTLPRFPVGQVEDHHLEEVLGYTKRKNKYTEILELLAKKRSAH